jgi:hypothetical protein
MAAGGYSGSRLGADEYSSEIWKNPNIYRFDREFAARNEADA